MRLVILESPYAGSLEEVERNIAYARLCLRDSLSRGESPIASHLLLTQVLDDNDPGDRALGIDAGLAWREVAHASVVYIDLGVTRGMAYGIAAARERGIPVEGRTLGNCGGICRHLVFVSSRSDVENRYFRAGFLGSRIPAELPLICDLGQSFPLPATPPRAINVGIIGSGGMSKSRLIEALANTHRPRVLVVDDESSLVRMLSRSLVTDFPAIYPPGLSEPRGRRRGQRRSRKKRF